MCSSPVRGGLLIVARMPVEFLSDAEAAAYGRYDGGPAREELDRMFFLDDADRELIEKRRGEHNRPGFALQLTTARWLGVFLPDPTDVPETVLSYVAGQLEIGDPSCVGRYLGRRPTRFDHAEEVMRACGVPVATAPAPRVPRPVACWRRKRSIVGTRSIPPGGCAGRAVVASRG